MELMKKRVAAALAGIMIIASIAAFGIVFSVDEVTEVYDKGAAFSGLNSGDIAEVADIHLGDNIFGIDETAAAKKVAAHFPDHSVVVQDIERVFPDKVIIKIKQRVPVVALALKNDGYALADIDFQLDRRADEVDFSLLIAAPDIVVDNTFNTEDCRTLRKALLAVKDCGLSEEGIAALVKSIRFECGSIIYTLRTGGIITVSKDNISAFAAKFAQYIPLNDEQKLLADL